MECGLRNKQQQNTIIHTAHQSREICIAMQCYRLGLWSLFMVAHKRYLPGDLDKESQPAMITGATVKTLAHARTRIRTHTTFKERTQASSHQTTMTRLTGNLERAKKRAFNMFLPRVQI